MKQWNRTCPCWRTFLSEAIWLSANEWKQARRFGAQKNRHFFQLERTDFKGKGGKSWDVEIEDMLPQSLVEGFVRQHPAAIEERSQRREVVKFVINGRPVERDGQTYDYKMMLAEYVRQHATLEDLSGFAELLQRAHECMGIKG